MDDAHTPILSFDASRNVVFVVPNATMVHNGSVMIIGATPTQAASPVTPQAEQVVSSPNVSGQNCVSVTPDGAEYIDITVSPVQVVEGRPPERKGVRKPIPFELNTRSGKAVQVKVPQDDVVRDSLIPLIRSVVDKLRVDSPMYTVAQIDDRAGSLADLWRSSKTPANKMLGFLCPRVNMVIQNKRKSGNAAFHRLDEWLLNTRIPEKWGQLVGNVASTLELVSYPPRGFLHEIVSLDNPHIREEYMAFFQKMWGVSVVADAMNCSSTHLVIGIRDADGVIRGGQLNTFHSVGHTMAMYIDLVSKEDGLGEVVDGEGQEFIGRFFASTTSTLCTKLASYIGGTMHAFCQCVGFKYVHERKRIVCRLDQDNRRGREYWDKNFYDTDMGAFIALQKWMQFERLYPNTKMMTATYSCNIFKKMRLE